MLLDMPLLSARLAAQLSREAPELHIERVARDAVRIAAVASVVRASNSPRSHVARIARTARHYGARVVHNADAYGMVIGLRFKSSRYSNAADNVLFVVCAILFVG